MSFLHIVIACSLVVAYTWRWKLLLIHFLLKCFHISIRRFELYWAFYCQWYFFFQHGYFIINFLKKCGGKTQFKNIEYSCCPFLYFFHNLPFNSLFCRNMAFLSIQDIQLHLTTRVFILYMSHCMKLGSVCGMLELPALKNILILGQLD